MIISPAMYLTIMRPVNVPIIRFEWLVFPVCPSTMGSRGSRFLAVLVNCLCLAVQVDRAHAHSVNLTVILSPGVIDLYVLLRFKTRYDYH